MNGDPRIQELLDLALSENITLPLPPEEIVALEEQGHVVNLRTGEIVLGEADREYIFEWTPAGEAVAHLVGLGLLEV